MNFFRNPEVKITMTASFILTAVLTVVGFFVGTATGILILIMGLALTLIWGSAAKKRYKKIEELSFTIDRILHSQSLVVLKDNQEGELAILESEIHKMTIRLREQAFALKKEKIYLTDSIADISHQLRTPLTTINILMDFLQKENLSNFEKKKHIKDISQNLTRIDWLISSLLKLSKIDAGTADFKNEKVSLAQLIEKAVKPLLIPMELRDQLFDYISMGNETFMGDINWTGEAVGNILKNCMEHTPTGGHIKVVGKENSLYTEIKISDNGPGINEEDKPHLFERFYKGSGSGENSVGIGLALSRTIIQEQNGSIKVENKIEKAEENDGETGAIFTIRFYKGTPILKQK